MHACACVFHTWWKCHDCIGIGNMQSGESEDILEYRICICLELMWIIRSLKCYKICIIHAIHSLINHKTCRYFTYLFEFQKIFVYSNTFLKVYISYKHSGLGGGGGQEVQIPLENSNLLIPIVKFPKTLEAPLSKHIHPFNLSWKNFLDPNMRPKKDYLYTGSSNCLLTSRILYGICSTRISGRWLGICGYSGYIDHH